MIRAIYELTCPAGEAERTLRDIAIEQTVEVPESLALAHPVAATLIAETASLEPIPGEPGRFRGELRYKTDLAADRLPQLLNLLFGNISIKPGIRLADVVFSESLLANFPGPRHGIEGVRAELGVYGRPLLSTALKPKGASPDELAAIAGAFARGGGDLIKDDHNLVETDNDAFRERVLRVRDAIWKANAATGRRTIYLPNLMHRVEEIDPLIDMLIHEGITGVLVSPLILGMDIVRRISARYPMLVMAHPALSGSFYTAREQGIAPAVLLGKLMRLAGADASVFPNHAGRFGLSSGDCDAISFALREPMGLVRPSWPAPAGGMNYERIPSMCDQYGADTILLIGGGLLSHSKDLADSTKLFLDAIRSKFEERLTPPEETQISSCELPSSGSLAALRPPLASILPFENFKWDGRPVVDYKADQNLPFHGVARHELIGPAGEKSSFDVRYFEVAPGGYTSFEMHRHTHTIIPIRGQGILLIGDEPRAMRQFDIGYVGPNQAHQLRNEGAEPFGFFCIVDRERDRPRPAPAR